MPKIAIVGPGAIGGTIAAYLGQIAGNEIVLCARTKVDQIEVETPSGKIFSKPRVLTTPQTESPADWILVATKAYDSKAAAAWLPGLTGPKTILAVLQNGVEHVERFAPYFDASRILPVVVDCPAERSEPGKIRVLRTGRMTLPDTPIGNAFIGLFDPHIIELVKTADFLTAAWNKLCLNSAGAVNALVLKPARVVAVPEAAELMRGIVRECIAVGRSVGAKLPDSLVESVIEGYRKANPESINSLHADRLANRPMETDARNGVIIRYGSQNGIPTPINAIVVALLKSIEAP